MRAYRRDISVEFERIVMKMTEPDRKNRFQLTEDVLLVLENYQKDGLVKRIKLYFLSKRRILVFLLDSGANEIFQAFPIKLRESADHTVFL